eukprot:gb/GEZN01016645.1/.p1 GENE.gb/GEZN01016645.1/~~gb/GEZN01016645.1/.p1  ORF type:complete len:102 (-),score=8.20 gb/GEZN01016645.1/:529-810(-)
MRCARNTDPTPRTMSLYVMFFNNAAKTYSFTDIPTSNTVGQMIADFNEFKRYDYPPLTGVCFQGLVLDPEKLLSYYRMGPEAELVARSASGSQ